MKTFPEGEIIFRLDMMLAREKMSIVELSEMIGVHVTNLSYLKNGHGKAIKYSTLVNICMALNCTATDLFDIRPKPGGKMINKKMEAINREEKTEEGEDLLSRDSE